MKRTAILVAFTMGLGWTAIGWLPSGAARAAGPALTTGALVQGQSPRPIRTLPGLMGMFVWLGPQVGSRQTSVFFGTSHTHLTQRLSVLDLSSHDMVLTNPPFGLADANSEFYDIYYSDADGVPNPDGFYLTVEAVYNQQAPAQGGLKLAEIGLWFGRPNEFEYGNRVASFTALGDNAESGSISDAIGGNRQTFTRLGNTVGQSQRLRITIGFLSSSGPPASGLFIEDTQVTEGDTGPVAAVFTVRLFGASSFPVTVTVSTQDFTATAPNDYTTRIGALTFNSGETLKTIAVPVSGDTLYEAHEQFYVNLTNPVNASIGRGQGVCTISDNDPGTLTICSSDVPKQEDPTTHIGHSAINVDKDSIIDDVNVSVSWESGQVLGFLSVGVDLRVPGTGREIKLIRHLPIVPIGNLRKLGTTCSPSPNCIIDDDAVTRINDAPPPYVGSFRPSPDPFAFANLTLPKLARMSHKGTWTLDFFDNSDLSSTLNCWCLKFDLAREGCRLAPDRATRQIFLPHTVRAILTSNGAPVSGQVVSFTVRGEQDELRLREDVTSNELGVAELSYYDFKPGFNFIEARAMVNGVLSIARAQVLWVANGLSGFDRCPFEESTASDPEAETTLRAARSFRDTVLTQTPRGERYTRLYYEFSTEAVRVMMFNPMLTLRSREIVERYKPVIQAMASGEAVTLTQGDLGEIDGFLNAFAAKGSPELQEAIKGVRHDLRDPQMHAEFGISVTDGPKRDLPAGEQIQGSKQMRGPAIFFGLCGLVIFAATGSRRKALRKHAGRVLVVLLALVVVANSRGQGSGVSGRPNNADLTSSISAPMAQSRIAERYQRQPIAFESNQGQMDSQVKFVSRGQGYTMFLTPTEMVMSLRRQKVKGKRQKWEPLQLTPDHRPPTADVLRMKLTGANPQPKITGLNRLPAVSNYFTGNDPARWRRGVPAYARVKYEAVYPGVDMVYYGNQGQLEYDFLLAPGADPAAIGLAFDGADHIAVDAAGDLVLRIAGGEVRQCRPLAYQEVNGERREIPCRYVIHQQSAIRNPEVGFEIGAYDKARPLIIDPVLAYSTYLGGRANDEGNSITVDAAGNAYVIGFTDSLDFPLANAAQSASGGGLQDAFVAKLDPAGAQLLYSTYLGGDGQDNGSAIAVDAAGNAYLTGYTGSTNFPALNAMQPANSGRFNAFVAKLNPAGGLVYSTHLGGRVGDYGSSIAVDAAGQVYVAGVATSPDFPMSNPLQPAPGGAADVYVAKLNPSGNSLAYSTYLGGADNDGATAIALDPAGNVYVTGVTSSPNFRTSRPLQAAHGGGLFDAFVAKLNPTGTQLIYSTYLGGGGEDRGFRVAVDGAGNAYVTGDTDSINFPTANALQRNKGGGVDAFVTKLDLSGAALTYSTYLGGSGLEGGTAIAVDAAGRAYVTGFTGSANFPTAAAVQQAFGGGSFDGFVARLNPAGAALDYSTWLGGSGIDSGFGIAVDAGGNAYVMGITDSADFPTAAPLQAVYGGGAADVFVAKIRAGPGISRAEAQGKKLLVFGSGFDSGAKALLNGQGQKTANDNQNPTTLLVAKKAGKKIAPGQTVTLQVRNSDGTLSNEFGFTRP